MQDKHVESALVKEFQKYDFDNDDNWKMYFLNITFPENLTAEKKEMMTIKFKWKYFRKNINAELPEVVPDTVLYSNATSNSATSAFKCCYQLVDIKPISSSHTATVIFLHGLGDSGEGWRSFFETMQVKDSSVSQIRFILPSASSMSVTLNYGMRMPSWFDIKGLTANSEEDEEGIRKAVKNISDLIEHEIQSGIPSERIVIGGFSQGGSIALNLGLTFKKKLGGIIAFSTFLSLRSHLEKEMSDQNLETPLLMCHGDADHIVQYQWGKLSYDYIEMLRKKTHNHPSKEHMRFITYNGMQHSSCAQEYTDTLAWIKKVIPPLPQK